MVGPNGLLTNIAAIVSFISAGVFILLVGRIVAKDVHLMKCRGYVTHFFVHRKRDIKILIAVWAIAVCGMLSVAVLSTR